MSALTNNLNSWLQPPREADMIWRTILRVAAAGREALVAAAEGGVPQVGIIASKMGQRRPCLHHTACIAHPGVSWC
jgi:hypothetical protein